MEQVVSADGTGIAYEAVGRARSPSWWAAPYAVEREIEDLAAVVAAVAVPVLAVTSTGTAPPWLSGTAEAVAAALPQGSAARLDGGFHEVPPAVLAPAPAAFYRAR